MYTICSINLYVHEYNIAHYVTVKLYRDLYFRYGPWNCSLSGDWTDIATVALLWAMLNKTYRSIFTVDI